eukprot:GHVR01113945.1.p1 GENE.GHVR01113945.1~~GHVR01113945.1.p1  ORF type:complete len:106 (-),score=13.90 GHVR01113945.1:326-643(-)
MGGGVVAGEWRGQPVEMGTCRDMKGTNIPILYINHIIHIYPCPYAAPVPLGHGQGGSCPRCPCSSGAPSILYGIYMYMQSPIIYVVGFSIILMLILLHINYVAVF